MSTLVIVESPAKARTIGGFLGPDYDVQASVGHIRDLPQPSELPASEKKGPYAKFAVNVDGNFEPYYAISPDKKKKVADLKSHLKNADELLLATDEDREGEAIAWHLNEVLKPKVPVKRMVFHEITQEAISRALNNPRGIDEQLVDAQESRRILDRLVGYEVSPLLWRKVGAGLSAGRVQSVATRLVVDRERERMAFIKASYWDVEATFTPADEAAGDPDEEPGSPDAPGSSFTAQLQLVDGQRIAAGKDFADNGVLAAKSAHVLVLTQTEAEAIAAACREGQFGVASLDTKPYRRRPAAPFTTSTLQQEAGRKLKMSARETMRVAQSLYENGFITYMRTDSTALSDQAVKAARADVARRFGKEYLPAKPRVWATKQKGAQEAHEAIRPAGDHFRSPADLGAVLNPAQLKLYTLIFNRTVASQMADAVGHTATVKIDGDVNFESEAGLLSAGSHALEFSASGTVITFQGFMKVYQESTDAKRYSAAESVQLPTLAQGDVLAATNATGSGHETTPPPRFTEASLVKKMEELGIGRPSTYASTIATITDRGYVYHRGPALVPTWTAFSVVRLLQENLPNLVDYQFTADMEDDLDKIANGKEDRVDYLSRFWRGDGSREGLKAEVEGLGDIDARAVNTLAIGDGIVVRVGRYGPYIQQLDADGNEVAHASIPNDLPPDELTVAKAHELLAAGADDGRVLGTDPDTNHQIVAKNGRFGPYVTEVIPDDEVVLTKAGKPSKRQPKPRTASLFATMALDTVTLDDALRLLRLPRTVGTAADGGVIQAQNGRFGPYLTKTMPAETASKPETRSLESEEQIFTITLTEAEALFAQPKTRRGRTAAAPLKEFGNDPASGKPVVLKNGRYGPYVTDGEVNASLQRTDDPATIEAARAFELLAARRERGPVTKRTSGTRGGTKRSTAKRAGVKRGGTKQSTAKTKASRKTHSNPEKPE
ncbi:MAG: type I DNA topoisomerase [Actinomycetaceae bacterium]|nr:type I DNA topoisomerase [Actinomycetaceae bacterium]MDY6082519.1 type I DNA topoisomerase [Actinomycetaceae bacterium]